MKILRWGLIGAGDIVRKRVAPALRDLENCDLVAVSRNQAELAAVFAGQFGVKKWFADWRELIADDEIEAVYIATPVFLHKEADDCRRRKRQTRLVRETDGVERRRMRGNDLRLPSEQS